MGQPTIKLADANGQVIAGVIFDLDDTLIASGATWQKAETLLLARLGRQYDATLAASYKGLSARDVGRRIHQQVQPKNLTAEQCGEFLRTSLMATARAHPTRRRPGASELVFALQDYCRLAVASGSPQPLIEAVLLELGWRECFSVLLSSESVARGKPHPDVFLAAADHLRLRPDEVLVIEDSLYGVQAAKAAGMRVWAVPLHPDPQIDALADAVLDSLEEFPLP